MIDDFIILDNFLPNSYTNAIEDFLLGEFQIPWLLLNDISYPADKLENETKLTTKFPAFAHVFKNEDGIYTEKCDFLLPIAYDACDVIKFNIKNILRVRTFLQPPSNLPSRKNNPHIDMITKHLVCLYYVNDSQGPTILYREKYPSTSVHDAGKYDFSIVKTVEPRKGRCLIFDGYNFHSSSSPTDVNRCVINFDIV